MGGGLGGRLFIQRQLGETGQHTLVAHTHCQPKSGLAAYPLLYPLAAPIIVSSAAAESLRPEFFIAIFTNKKNYTKHTSHHRIISQGFICEIKGLILYCDEALQLDLK